MPISSHDSRLSTASLPGFHERRHRRNQGKPPVCPTFAPRLSLFQDAANGVKDSSKSSNGHFFQIKLRGLRERHFTAKRAEIKSFLLQDHLISRVLCGDHHSADRIKALSGRFSGFLQDRKTRAPRYFNQLKGL